MESKTSIARASSVTGVWIACVVLRASSVIASCRQSALRSRAFQSGWKRCAVLVAIHVANPSFSHRLSHHAIVTRLPNHWCATSCAMMP